MSNEIIQNNPTPSSGSHGIAWWIATVGGIGRSPVAPGTCGSLVALPMAWVIASLFGEKWLFLVIAIMFIIGWVCASIVSRKLADHDPQEVVIDEVVGQWIALLFVPFNWHWYIVAFVFFRLFDIIKPWPINEAEKRFQNGFGIMIDDVIAGIFALISTQAIYLIISLF